MVHLRKRKRLLYIYLLKYSLKNTLKNTELKNSRISCMIYSWTENKSNCGIHVMSHHCAQKAAVEWPYNLPLFMPQPQLTDGNRVQQWDIKYLEELTQHGYRATGSTHILPGNIFLWKYINDKLLVWDPNWIFSVTFWALQVWRLHCLDCH